MFTINGRKIGNDAEPYVVAELSANHNGSLDRAKETIGAAKMSGAHAVKLQTYSADTMTLDCDKPDFLIKGGLWDGYSLYTLYKEASTPYEWHQELFRYARELGIDCFSTPFDETAVELLEELEAPAYKIASFELTDLLLIKRVAQTGKPLLISTGMASEDEVRDAVATAREAGCNSILLFHCISSYPAPTEQANLRRILNLKETFGVEVGLSDHTLGPTAAVAAVALGATAIEKHLTLSRSEKGPDSEFSMEPHELAELVRATKDAWSALGSGAFIQAPSEEPNLAFRRSLYFVRNLPAGATITPADVRRIRPGFGLSPKHYDSVIGRRLKVDVTIGDPVKWESLA